MRLISALLFASSALLSVAAAAQTRIYCCNDAGGRKVCGDFLPTVCQGRAYEERDNRGFVSKTVEAPLTAEQQARRDAELARKEAEARKAAEERRRNLALLATYSSAKDIDSARDRSLAEVEKAMKQAQQRLDEANKKKKKLESDKEFYKGKPLPEQVKADIRDNEKEIKAQQDAVAAKLKEMDDVRSRFADEKKRYLDLTGKKAEEAVGAAPAVAAPTAPVAAPAQAAAPAAAAKPAEKK
jgi:phage-related minor tail protein